MGNQLFSNINLDAIEFASNGNEIKLKFLDSIKIESEHILELVCKRVKEFRMEVDLDEMDEYVLPFFFFVILN
ncbi:hypothetical protein [Paenibacillus kandeliae]|uniref:hypothetical protein n=1 Tax=Paenibacillus kandeliae TaxID=3231269 RepID=UPI0034577D6D